MFHEQDNVILRHLSPPGTHWHHATDTGKRVNNLERPRPRPGNAAPEMRAFCVFCQAIQPLRAEPVEATNVEEHFDAAIDLACAVCGRPV
jgi:hypothetical protein